MNEDLVAALLDAGAVVPAGAPVAKDDTVDTLTARAYRHPVLDDRIVVRLTPGTLGEAEDLSLDFLGFAPPDRVDEVGLVRQQALGFPAWAIVHDPANGHHALALVKDIERFARMAKSRIGAANDGFNSLAERLARSVPHFLPTFYEEAGRAFIAADSPTYAASMFGKAREAERVYGLSVDEERQHAVFLEFALAGALTAKALSAHARELAARCEPAAAYERFRRLCVERTLGGLPPYAEMHTDLRRLAKASGLDPLVADGLVLGELLAAPSIGRAPAAFWTAYRVSLGRLGAQDPVLRGRLLGMVAKNCPDDVWLGLLADAGALAALTGPAGAVPVEAGPADGPAGWLGRFAAHRAGRSGRDVTRYPPLLELVERMAPRLVADGQPVALCRPNSRLDLDLLDTCLALGVPVRDPESSSQLPVPRWFGDETPGRRDLAALAADPRFRDGLAAGVEGYLGNGHSADRVDAVLAVPGLREALRYWLGTVADTVVRQGLPTLAAQLDRMTLAASPAGFAVNPEAAGRVAAYDLAPVLGRTLRAGVLDEYGWPAWDEAVERLITASQTDAAGKEVEAKLTFTRQWPALLVRRGTRVLAVGPQRVELDHETRIPKGQRSWLWRLVLRYVDGELLVCWDKGPDRAGYWTNRPDDVFVVPDDAFTNADPPSLPLPGGGRTFGGRPLRVGDRAEEHAGAVISDGVTYWTLHRQQEDRAPAWYEFDPATGRRGRASLPTFIEEGAVDGQSLRLASCWLAPVTGAGNAGERDGGPFGERDGLGGWRVRSTEDGRRTGEGVDGRAFVLSRRARAGLSGELVAGLRFPGSDAVFGLLRHQGWNSESATLCDADGFVLGTYRIGEPKQRFARGARRLPPTAFWQHLRPRDPVGSAALRLVTDARAGELLAGAAGRDRAGIAELVARLLPEVTDPALRAGIAGVLRVAAKRAARQRDFAAVLSGQVVFPKVKAGKAKPAPEDKAPPLAPDTTLYRALEDLIPYCICRDDSGLRMLTAAADALAGPQVPTGKWAHAGTDVDWYAVLGVLPAAAYLAVAPFTPDEQRAALVALLDRYAASGLSTPGAGLRRVELTGPRRTGVKVGAVLTVDRRRLLVIATSGPKSATALEFAPDGQFGPVPGFTITKQTPHPLPAGIGALVAALRENGPPALRPELAATLSAQAGIGHADALYLLAGLPGQARAAALGLSAALCEAARETWRDVGAGPLLARLLPDDPATLWTQGPDLRQVTAWRLADYGRRAPVPDDLIETVHRARVAEPLAASEFLHGIANPDTCSWLGSPVSGDPDSVPEPLTVVTTLARAVSWLAYHLPADHALRARLPEAVERARQRLLLPGVSAIVGYLPDRKAVSRVVAAIGGTPTKGRKSLGIGPLEIEDDDYSCWVRLRPAELTGSDDPVLSILLAHFDSEDSGQVHALRLLLSGQLAAAVVPATGPADGFPHDPSRSAAELVTAVGAALGIGADAATVYLQLLALPDPTDRNVARWTGWRPARLAAARKELVATGHVVQAKRTRAGRSLFLPGGWLSLRSPLLPVERWKIPLLTLQPDGSPLLDVVVPVEPLPRIFEVAWQRVRDGDRPRFDELTTTERRR